MPFTTVIFLTTSIVLFSSAASGDVFLTREFDVRVSKNVTYGSASVREPRPGKKELQADVYEPAGPNAPRLRPAFVVIHGGGLRRGDKATENMVQLCEEMAARGYVCVSINYRLQGDDPPVTGPTLGQRTLSAAVEDALTAVRWMRANSRGYRVDSRRIAVGGSSAGATVALRLAFSPDGRRLDIPALFSWSGGLYTSPGYVDRGKTSLMIVHGDNDSDVDAQEVRRLTSYAHASGLRTVSYFCEGLGHNVPLDRRPGGQSLYDRLAAFLHEEMELERIGTPLTHSQRPATPAPDLRPVPCPH